MKKLRDNQPPSPPKKWQLTGACVCDSGQSTTLCNKFYNRI